VGALLFDFHDTLDAVERSDAVGGDLADLPT
jgi:hypothetical protein